MFNFSFLKKTNKKRDNMWVGSTGNHSIKRRGLHILIDFQKLKILYFTWRERKKKL